MADKVCLHIGLPKTATTYVQTIMWGARDQMRAEGVLLPGDQRRDHLWSSRIVREDPRVPRRPERQQTAWARLTAEIRAWPGTAVVSHEFFAAASAEQAVAVIDALAPAEVHLVVTAREPLGLFAASWQEGIKNRERVPLSEYADAVSESPLAVWNWRTLDLRLVLERWAATLPPDRVHVLPLPDRSAPRDLIWQRFAAVVGLDPANYDASSGATNSSMGVAEAETLRRINEHLAQRGLLTSAVERGTMIRSYLAHELLVPRGGDRFWPTEAQIRDCRSRGAAAVEYVSAQGFDVVGELADLLVPGELEQRRTPASVTDAEVAEIATDLVAQLADEVQEMRVAVGQLRRRLEEEGSSEDSTDLRIGRRVKRALRVGLERSPR